MKPEEQRIAIAEACGWKQLPKARRINAGWRGYANALWSSPLGVPEENCPDYLNDLNAMSEAEKCPSLDMKKYLWELEVMLGLAEWVPVVCAKADQRAEAFLKAKGLWKE